MRMTWIQAEKIFHNWRYKQGATTRQVGGIETQSSQNPHVRADNPKTERISQLQRSSLRSKCSEPAPESCTKKMSPQNIRFWNPARLTFRIVGGYRKQRLLLKGTEAVVWKAPASDPLANLWKQSCIARTHSQPQGEPALPTSRPKTVAHCQAAEPVTQGACSTYQGANNTQSSFNRRVHAAHIEDTTGESSSDGQRGAHC